MYAFLRIDNLEILWMVLCRFASDGWIGSQFSFCIEFEIPARWMNRRSLPMKEIASSKR